MTGVHFSNFLPFTIGASNNLRSLFPDTETLNEPIKEVETPKEPVEKPESLFANSVFDWRPITLMGSAMAQISLSGDSTVANDPTIASEQDVHQAVQEAVSNSFKSVPSRVFEDRHELNTRLQSQGTDRIHYDGSDVVVIAFEGTGAFNPRMAPIMQEVADNLHDKGLSLEDTNYNISGKISEALTAKSGKPTAWSGLANGPLETLLANPELQQKSQWLSFPSEELEILAAPDAYKKTSLKDIVQESMNSYNGNTPGINSALRAVKDIQAQAKAQGKNPKFVIVSHSSGGRSAVKFLELAKNIKDDKGQRINFPFALTIDPVREAHEAVMEAGKELFYKGTEHNMNRVRSLFSWAGVEQEKVYPPTVRSRSQPESLYKPGNVGKMINFYQQKDTNGLKMDPRFGIHGSPIKGAENHEIHNVGASGHGEIAYQSKVTDAFIAGLSQLK